MTQYEQENDFGRGGGEVDQETYEQAWRNAERRRGEEDPVDHDDDLDEDVERRARASSAFNICVSPILVPVRHRGHPRSRSRRLVGPGRWHVHARVERFVEPSLLLLLRERPLHGYELLERLPELGVEGRVDIGNLYRLLRALEQEGLVASEWSDELPGPAKRTYELTDDGRRVLDTWAEALGRAQSTIARFLERYEEGR